MWTHQAENHLSCVDAEGAAGPRTRRRAVLVAAPTLSVLAAAAASILRMETTIGVRIGRQISTDQAVQRSRPHERVNASARPDPSKATSHRSMGRRREVSPDECDVTLLRRVS